MPLKLGLSGAVPNFRNPPLATATKTALVTIAAGLAGGLIAAVLVMRQGLPHDRSSCVPHSVPEDADLRCSGRAPCLVVLDLWVRSLDAFSARPVAGTDRAQHPSWSPDGRYISFASEEIKESRRGGADRASSRFTGGHGAASEIYLETVECSSRAGGGRKAGPVER